MGQAMSSEEHGKLVHDFTEGRRSALARYQDLGDPQDVADVTSERVHLARLTGLAGDVHGNHHDEEEYPR